MSKHDFAAVGPYAKGDDVYVVVETPSGSRTKYAWNPDARTFQAKTVLPLGLTFPYDFGFIPGTRADDGDPLDALVLADAPLAVGTLVECRVLGAFCVKQSDPGKDQLVRNDRLVVVPKFSIRGAEWRSLSDIGDALTDEICAFFRNYVERQGRKFEELATVQHAAAMELVKGAER
ncbi:MAG: Inorganic pyrophosphatase [Myxococcales bacterium]|nr:Inorganic pyrophosphatase [Myxococcales bacterium]